MCDELFFSWLPSSLTLGVLVDTMISFFAPVHTAELLAKEDSHSKNGFEAETTQMVIQAEWSSITYPSNWICVWMKGLY